MGIIPMRGYVGKAGTDNSRYIIADGREFACNCRQTNCHRCSGQGAHFLQHQRCSEHQKGLLRDWYCLFFVFIMTPKHLLIHNSILVA